VAVAPDDSPVPTLLLDAGTGVRGALELMGERPFLGTILLSHLHWDHMHGIPFFRSADREDARTTLLVPEQPDGSDAVTVLAQAMSPPHFPISPADLGGSWTFASAAEGEFDCEGFTVLARELPHKGGRTFGYRVSDGRTSLAYMPDHCPTVLGAGPDGCGEYHAAAMELADGADLLVHDAQLLSAEELATQARFGHASVQYAIGLGQRAGARRVVLFHHRHNRTDDELAALARRYGDAEEVTVAVQGLTIEL
jgi:phosphoribosyl 1,2-cyclic phosphodiesterase